MSPDEYEKYRSLPTQVPLIRADEIPYVPADGVTILMHGYEPDRSNFFVGVRIDHNSIERGRGARLLGRAIDAPHGLIWEWQKEWSANRLVPNKRIFPERTDFVFAKMLRDRTEFMPPMLDFNHQWVGWDRKRLPKDANPGQPWAPIDCDYAEGTKIR